MNRALRSRAVFRGEILAAALLFVSAAFSIAAAASEQNALARQVLDATGVKGGLVVHLGCGDGELTAALHANERYLVHGLDCDAADIEKAREHIRSLKLCGKVSVERFSGGRLPYVDNLVNLLVADELGDVPMDEVLRVLAPDGMAYVKQNGKWTKTVKPRPKEIAEWTHTMYDSTNNAVSNDQVVGPPRQLQWVGGPKWTRSHDHLASISAAVTAGGRIFYIADEAPIAAVVLQPQWKLVARDAFSGVVLWKRPIPKWQYHLRGFRAGPSDLSRRLIALDDRVYVTLGIDAPLTALDAATGETITTYEGTEGTLEVVHSGGTLFVVAGDMQAQQAAEEAKRRGERPGFAAVRSQRPGYPDVPPTKRIVALDAASGRVMWKKSDSDTTELMPTTLAVSGDRAYFQNSDEIICLDARVGGDVWRVPRPVSRARPTWSAPTLVVYGDVVLSGDRAVAQKKPGDGDDMRQVDWTVSSAGGQAPVGELIAFSAEDGSRLWSTQCKEGYNAPVDVLVADGLVWTGELVRAKEPGITKGLDPKTGEVKRTRPNDHEYFEPGMGHARCHRNRGTNKYLVLGRSGVELIDLATGVGIPNHWTRGTCQYGVIPANGLLYIPPHSCACFIRSKLSDFNCLTPRAESGKPKAESGPRLERGPAYSEVRDSQSATGSQGDWPTYRHDAARSGHTGSAVPAELRQAWQVELGGKLSSAVVADGMLLVAQVDAHTVHALAADDGQRMWSYTAGGRVDSPPTILGGRVLFGSADGWVYCLRATDGALAWRFRAAPEDERIVAYGRLESAWPVSGSVLVHNGVVYCAAGRSSYLDGGIRLCRIDAKTGKLLSETCLDHRDPETGYQRKGSVKVTNMPGALPDVLSCDGESVFMRHTRFDLAGQVQEPDVEHLFSSAGFLDDAWWHRTYWMVGKLMSTNYGGWPQVGSRVPAGRLLVLDDPWVYGFGRSQFIHHGAHVGIDGSTIFHFRPDRDAEHRSTNYQAFAINRESPLQPPKRPAAKPPAKKTGKPAAKKAARKPAAKRRRQPPAPRKQYRWTEKLPVLARAMVLAPDVLFLAGPPDIFEVDDPAAALAGKKGGMLCALSSGDGKKLAQVKLDSPPVFDGMAAARGRLYLATMNGKVVCFAGK